jgi:hypothetical protein
MKLFRYHPLMRRFLALVVSALIRRDRSSVTIRPFAISARFCALGGLLVSLAAIAGPAQAADLWVAGYSPPPSVEVFCAECIRDDIYADTKLIVHLEANPDIDEAFKGPIILAARADVHRLRKILGPGERISAAPCCYFRKRLYVR